MSGLVVSLDFLFVVGGASEFVVGFVSMVVRLICDSPSSAPRFCFCFSADGALGLPTGPYNRLCTPPVPKASADWLKVWGFGIEPGVGVGVPGMRWRGTLTARSRLRRGV